MHMPTDLFADIGESVQKAGCVFDEMVKETKRAFVLDRLDLRRHPGRRRTNAEENVECTLRLRVWLRVSGPTNNEHPSPPCTACALFNTGWLRMYMSHADWHCRGLAERATVVLKTSAR